MIFKSLYAAVSVYSLLILGQFLPGLIQGLQLGLIRFLAGGQFPEFVRVCEDLRLGHIFINGQIVRFQGSDPFLALPEVVGGFALSGLFFLLPFPVLAGFRDFGGLLGCPGSLAPGLLIGQAVDFGVGVVQQGLLYLPCCCCRDS